MRNERMTERRRRSRAFRLAMVEQRLMGLGLVLIFVLLIVICSHGVTVEDQDATAVLLTLPLGLYLIFTKNICIYSKQTERNVCNSSRRTKHEELYQNRDYMDDRRVEKQSRTAARAMSITRSSTLAALYEARANDFDGLADRLREAVDNNNKRIAIGLKSSK